MKAIKNTQIDRIYLIFRPRVEGFFKLIAHQGTDEGAITGMVGLSLFEATQQGFGLQLSRPASKEIRDLLLKALWGNPSAMRKLLKMIINQQLKKSDLAMVMEELTKRCNAGHHFALELIQTLALEAPGQVLANVTQLVSECCKNLGNYQALELLKHKNESTPSRLPVPRPKKSKPDPLE